MAFIETKFEHKARRPHRRFLAPFGWSILLIIAAIVIGSTFGFMV